MTIRAEHEIHSRRKGRNLGVGLMLGAFVVLVMAMTFVKITSTDFSQMNGAAPKPAATQVGN